MRGSATVLFSINQSKSYQHPFSGLHSPPPSHKNIKRNSIIKDTNQSKKEEEDIYYYWSISSSFFRIFFLFMFRLNKRWIFIDLWVKSSFFLLHFNPFPLNQINPSTHSNTQRESFFIFWSKREDQNRLNVWSKK